MSYSRPLRQEAIRYESTNAENLTAHLVAIEAIIEEHNLDPSRNANLDETGITPSRDCARVSGARAFLSSTNGLQEQMPSFKNADRVTVMPVILPMELLGVHFTFSKVPNSSTGLLKKMVHCTISLWLTCFLRAA